MVLSSIALVQLWIPPANLIASQRMQPMLVALAYLKQGMKWLVLHAQVWGWSQVLVLVVEQCSRVQGEKLKHQEGLELIAVYGR